jgi:hypothetical protein
MQAYSDPSRETEPYALPDIEIFWVGPGCAYRNEEGELLPEGYYWWSCFPGCLPDGDPIGPFETEEEALHDAQSDYGVS